MTLFAVPDPFAEASRAQRRAADPAASVWVGASAGTGKTKVLTDRVLCLLLAGIAPTRLLCLTFTKAAAAEMANRLAARLAGWAARPETVLRRELHDLLGRMPDDAEATRARQLFARTLDAPGGLKIQTLHSFCQSLLARFPLEAGVAPTFQVIDDATAAELRREAREQVLAALRVEDPPGPLAAELAHLSALLSDGGFAELLDALIDERGRFRRLADQAGSVAALIAGHARHLGVAPDATPEAVAAAALALPPEVFAALDRVAAALEQGGSEDRARGAALVRVLGADDRGPLWPAYLSVFFTKDGEPRKRLATKAVIAACPDAVTVQEAECERLAGWLPRIQAAGVLAATRALLLVGDAVLARYARLKAATVALDYDDLILAARDLLAQDGGCGWVHFKLDGGLDHVLIDEAQDTNPEQWEVVAALTREFFVGEGASERTRTVFVVGDRKQSIFSFQRADVAAFQAMHRYFAAKVRATPQEWRSIDLDVSFRSTDAVLATVDAVFAQAPAADGVDDGIRHQVSRLGMGGLVELWPPAVPAPVEPAPAWVPQAGRQSEVEPRTRVAQLVAAKIRRLLDGERLPSRGTVIEPGDILVLVRTRGPFTWDLVRECKRLGVPIAGVDRMVLIEQLAVMDLVALGRVLLQPDDDLTLATVLKSPLIGLDEERLFDLAWNRPGTLWRALQESADPVCAAAAAQLAEWRAGADRRPPFELFAELLHRGGRRRLVERLSDEANDAIDEFLGQAIAFERSHPPSLEGFLHWLEAGALEVNRPSDMSRRDEVRIMTVHGAKGLQAPIVFLPDTLQAPTRLPPLFWPDGAAPLWSPRKAMDDPVAAAARQAAEAARDREYRRLLYVALTRAEDRLYVTGWAGRREAPDGCWYALIRDGLAGLAEPVAFDFDELGQPGWSGRGWRYETPQRATPRPPAATVSAAVTAPAPPFAAPAPAEPVPGRPLAPSRPTGLPAARSPLADDGAAGYRRGRLIHRLLQALPEIQPGRRATHARRFLERRHHGLGPDEVEAILAETLRVLDDPAFGALWGPGSRAEVPLTGRVGAQVVAGQIDRLAVTPDRVLIVDFKTNRPAPATLETVASAYIAQLALYRVLVGRIYPGRVVEAALLWTDGPRLMPIPGPLLDAAQTRVLREEAGLAATIPSP